MWLALAGLLMLIGGAYRLIDLSNHPRPDRGVLLSAANVAGSLVLLAIGVFLVFLSIAPVVHAQSVYAVSTVVDAPIGDWGIALATAAAAIVGAILTRLLWIVVGFLPDWLRAIITPAIVGMVDQLLRRAMSYAIEAVEDAWRGKTMSVDVGAAFVAEALNFVIKNGPGWLINWMGGVDGIKDKIIARLNDLEMGLDQGVSPEAVKAAANDNARVAAQKASPVPAVPVPKAA